MGVSIGDLEGAIRLRDHSGSVLDAASAKFAQVGSKLDKIGARMTKVGGQISTKVSAPLGVLSGVAITSFGNFDQAMSNSLAIMGDVSDGMKNRLSVAARQAAVDVGGNAPSAVAAAEAYFFLASAGLDAESSLQALMPVTRFAKAGNFDLALATDLLTDAQSALGLTIRDDAVANMENMVHVSDVLVGANTLANASVQQFATSLTTKAGASMRLLNIDIEEGVAVLAAWADQGVKGELAGERFSIVTRDLQKAWLENTETFKDYNIEVFDAVGGMNPLADVIADLEVALADMSDEQVAATLKLLGFQFRSVSAIKSLLGLSGQIKDYEERLRSMGGITDEVAQRQMQALWAQLGLLKNQFLNVTSSIVQSIRPAIDSLIVSVSALLNWIGTVPEPLGIAIAALTGLAVAAGPVILLLGVMMSAFGAVAGAVSLVTVGWIAAGVAAATLIASWEPARELFLTIGNIIYDIVAVAFQILWDLLGGLIVTVVELAGWLATGLVEALTIVAKWVESITDKFMGWWESTELLRTIIVALTEDIVGGIVDAVKIVYDWWVKIIARTIDWIKESEKFQRLMYEVRLVIDFVSTSVGKLYDWVVRAVQIWVEWIGALIDSDPILSRLQSLLGTTSDALKDWVDRAVEAATETTRATSALVDFSTELTEGTVNIEAMDAAGAAFVAELKELELAEKAAKEEARKLQERMESLALKTLELRLRIGELKTDLYGAQLASNAVDMALADQEIATQELDEITIDLVATMGDGYDASLVYADGVAFVKDEANKAGDALVGMALKVDNLSKFLDRAGDSLNALSGPINQIFGAGTAAKIGNIVDIGQNVAGAFQAVASGNIWGAIQHGVGAVTGAFNSLFPSTKSVEERIEIYFQHFRDGEGTTEHFTKLTYDLAKSLRKVAEDGWDFARASKMMEKNFSEFVDVALTMGDEGIRAIEEVVAAAEQSGVGLEQIADRLRGAYDEAFDIMEQRSQFLLNQSQSLVDNLTDYLGDVSTATAGKIEFASGAMIGAFNAMVEAGVPLTDIVTELGGLFGDIYDRGIDLGVDLGEEFSGLNETFNLLADEGLQASIGKLENMTGVVEALGNMGRLTVEQFNKLAGSIGANHTRMLDMGIDGPAALSAISPQLQVLLNMSEQYGYEINDNTQALIDEAEQLGLVASQGMSTEDILIHGFNAMLEGVNALIVALGGVPVAFNDWTESFNTTENDFDEGIDHMGRKVDNFAGHLEDRYSVATATVSGATDVMGDDFASTLDGMQDYNDAVQDAIAASAVSSADIVSDAWAGAIYDIDLDYRRMINRLPGIPDFDIPDLPSGGGGGSGPVPRFHQGSGSMWSFGSGTVAELHDIEQVVTLREGQSLIAAVQAITRNNKSGSSGDMTATNGILRLILAEQERSTSKVEDLKGRLIAIEARKRLNV